MHRLAWLSAGGTRQWLIPLSRDSEEIEAARTPLDPTQRMFEREPRTTSRWIVRATWGFVALGLLVRLVRFLVNYPIWPDEAFVAVNLMNRDYRGLQKPLEFGQIAPLLFLWIELTAARLLGVWEWSLRLFPTVCSLASVIVFRHLAARLLRGLPLLLAVGVFATAASPIRHGAEVKPYASDLLAALVLVALAVEWWRAPRRSRYWWALGIAAPALLALSYPAVFVATGVSVALGTAVLRQEGGSVRRAYVFYNAMLAGSFLFLYVTFTSVQSAAMLAIHQQNSWRNSFPPWAEPWKLPAWLIATHTGNMLAYPIGGAGGASTTTFVFTVAGVMALWRRGRRTPLALLLWPAAMGLTAAALGRYPYGGSARIMQYLAPSICLLTGLGISILLVRLLPPACARLTAHACAALLASLGIYLIASDLVRPYRVHEDDASRRFARWLWSESSPCVELLCVNTDLGLVFQPALWKTGMSAVYLYHQRLYNHRGRIEPGDGLCLKAATRPLRLVFFGRIPDNKPTFRNWLATISADYQVGRRWEFVVNPAKPDQLGERDRYGVLELIPRDAVRKPSRLADSQTIVRE